MLLRSVAVGKLLQLVCKQWARTDQWNYKLNLLMLTNCSSSVLSNLLQVQELQKPSDSGHQPGIRDMATGDSGNASAVASVRHDGLHFQLSQWLPVLAWGGALWSAGAPHKEPSQPRKLLIFSVANDWEQWKSTWYVPNHTDKMYSRNCWTVS